MDRACPSTEQLLRMISGEREDGETDVATDPEAGRLVEAHVGGCPLCQAELDRLTSEDDSLRFRLAPGPEARSPTGTALSFLDRARQVPPTLFAPAADDATRESGEGGGERPGDAGPSDPGAARPSIPGYEIERELGRGGMGIIYLARQLRPSRYAAIKMIGAVGGDRADSLLRLSMEGEALARLRHPNIVPIYEVGEAQGYPFLSMEYVEGGNLAGAMARWTPSPRQAAALIQTLARAVHAAHQSGIIHRDLKPANVLLAPPPDDPAGPGGFDVSRATPKISDFGLAKRLGGDSDLTRTGQILGTPRFMAPEQVTQGATVGIPADVYALGAMLYEMLAGRAPFQGDTPWDTLMQVVHQPAEPPSRHREGIPRDLEVIALKCLEKDPEKRYASASALAEDLGRHLAGEPIAARPVGPWRRLWLWCRRKPGIAAMAAALALVSLAGMAGVVSQWARAERNLREARLQERRAAGNFRLARSAVDDTLTRVSENRLFREPGMQDLRKELLSAALRYYQQFVEFQGDDPATQLDLMAAYRRLGDITREIGSIEDAKGYYLKGLERAQALAAGRPGDLELMRERAELLLSLGVTQLHSRQAEAAARSDEEAVALFRSLRRARGDDPDVRVALAHALTMAATGRVHAGKLDEAEVSLREAIAALEGLGDSKARHALASARRGLGETLVRIPGRLGEAMASLRAATEIWRALAREDPGNFSAAEDLASNNLQLADALIFQNRAREALELLRPAREVLEPLVRENPRVSSMRHGLGLVDYVTGSALFGLGDHAEALRSYERALDQLGRVAREHPTEERYQSPGLAGIHLSMGELHRNVGDLAAAAQTMRAALEIQAEATRRHPDNLANRVNLAMVHRSIGMVQVESGDPAGALASARLALEILEKASPPGAPNVMVESELYQARLVLAAAERKAGHPAAALEGLRRVEADLARLSSGDPENVEYRMQLGLCRCRIGALEHALGRDAEALRAWEQARPLIEGLPLDVSDRLFALAILRSARIPLLAGRDPAAEAGRRRQGELAVDALRRAVALGFKNRVWLDVDPELEPVRGRPDFQALARSIPTPAIKPR
ncbi:Serine/threonine-protein kinase PknB [Aquisphaera giovannonii]|uniref:Serine/threonine-protein kinase PknB n=1 Tax=Aquisphaera giovannonii TaxID=406548 RepID=A0A5B9WFC7_9BACT|nr:serine/threonine-protein kinase [Aquisphaera giovannonii]QEH39183.1 Serine/threonine-protein kinase PknB [Aquisphaera giovannonii]